MRAAMLLILVMLAQDGDRASMEFTNHSDGQTITIWVWCYGHNAWANDQKPLLLRPNTATHLPLHTGRFRVYLRDQLGPSWEISERQLVSNEVARMNFEAGRPVAPGSAGTP